MWAFRFGFRGWSYWEGDEDGGVRIWREILWELGYAGVIFGSLRAR